jgi:hypothetical protein
MLLFLLLLLLLSPVSSGCTRMCVHREGSFKVEVCAEHPVELRAVGGGAAAAAAGDWTEKYVEGRWKADCAGGEYADDRAGPAQPSPASVPAQPSPAQTFATTCHDVTLK